MHCAEYKNRNKKGDDDSLIEKNMNTLLLKSKKIANFKSQLLTEHKEVIPSKYSGSSPKKSTWFAYETVLFLLQHKDSIGYRSTRSEEENDASVFSNLVKV